MYILCTSHTHPYLPHPPRRQWQDAAHGHEGAAALLAENAAEEAAAAAALKLRRVSPTDDYESPPSHHYSPSSEGGPSPGSGPSPRSASVRDRSPGTDVKLYHRAVVVAQDPGGCIFWGGWMCVLGVCVVVVYVCGGGVCVWWWSTMHVE